MLGTNLVRLVPNGLCGLLRFVLGKTLRNEGFERGEEVLAALKGLHRDSQVGRAASPGRSAGSVGRPAPWGRSASPGW